MSASWLQPMVHSTAYRPYPSLSDGKWTRLFDEQFVCSMAMSFSVPICPLAMASVTNLSFDKQLINNDDKFVLSRRPFATTSGRLICTLYSLFVNLATAMPFTQQPFHSLATANLSIQRWIRPLTVPANPSTRPLVFPLARARPSIRWLGRP